MSKVTLRPSRESGAPPQPLDSNHSGATRDGRPRVLCVFGTRPEVIKLAPVLRALRNRTDLEASVVSSGQHTSLLYPFLEFFGIHVDEDLHVMQPDQTPNEVCARVMAGLEPIVRREKPALILVQGDTTTALAGAMTGFHHRIPVGHVEAGLRSGDPLSPLPCYRVGGKILVRRGEFDAWLRQHRKVGSTGLDQVVDAVIGPSRSRR